MSVEPGRSGQKFMEYANLKVKKLKQMDNFTPLCYNKGVRRFLNDKFTLCVRLRVRANFKWD